MRRLMRRQAKGVRLDPRLHMAVDVVATRRGMTIGQVFEASVIGLLPPEIQAQIKKEFEALCEESRQSKP